MHDFAQDSATSLLENLRAGRCTSVAVTEHLLERIAALNPQLNAVILLRSGAALAEAAALDAERAAGQLRGPLHGLPMTVKDALDVKGLPTVCGAPVLRDNRPAEDATVVARLRAAGAIILGKTNVPLYAADFQTFNEVFGTTRNPWALDRSPGGSSGGAAAAVAAGLSPVEIGTDLSGSLRIPAHACGVASLKPSHGVVPLAGSLSAPAPRRRHGELWAAGPIARQVRDLGLLLDVVAGPDAPDVTGWSLSLPAPRRGSLRVALWLLEPFCPPDPDVRLSLERAAKALSDSGLAMVRPARPPVGDAEGFFRLHCGLMYGEMSAGLPDEVFGYLERRAAKQAEPVPLGRVADLQATGIAQSHRRWLGLMESREALREACGRFFRDHDVLLCPAAPTTATLHDPRRLDQRTQRLDGQERPALHHCFWAALASTLGLPSVTVPVARGQGGLPIGAQLIGNYLQDRTVLRAAEMLEQVGGGFVPPPESGGRFRATAGDGL